VSSPIVQKLMSSVNVYINPIHSRMMADRFVYSIDDNVIYIIFYPSGFSNVYLIT